MYLGLLAGVTGGSCKFVEICPVFNCFMELSAELFGIYHEKIMARKISGEESRKILEFS